MSFPKQNHEPSKMGTVGVKTVVDLGSINDMMVCAYDESHVCGAGRYHTHLKECRKAKGYTDEGGNSTATDAGLLDTDDGLQDTDVSDAGKKPEPEKPEAELMVVCPYNPSHHVHRSVLKKHVTLCDSFYVYCMETQEEPPSMKRERKSGTSSDSSHGASSEGGSSKGESSHGSSTDTDTDTEEGNYPEEVARRLKAMHLMAKDVDADGNPIVFSSASSDDDEVEEEAKAGPGPEAEEVYFSAASDIEQ